MTIHTLFNHVLQRKQVSAVNDYEVVTDTMAYTQIDQVLPIFAEQLFFLDELALEKIKGAKALEIGLGSGVLSIGAVKAGAARVTALEINPRAKNTAGFNIVLNGLEDRIAIIDGSDDIFQPVKGQTFDYIISNPPFEPTPPDVDYFYHSAAGLYGLDFIEKIFQAVDDYLTADGHLQIVTGAPGDREKPFLLIEMAEKYLSGSTTILLNAGTLNYAEAIGWYPEKGLCTVAQANFMKQKAAQDGVTDYHLCVIHYQKGAKQIQVKPAKVVYENWYLPPETQPEQEPVLI
ncbi:MAG: methyltransferase [Blastocatellia bacterium]